MINPNDPDETKARGAEPDIRHFILKIDSNNKIKYFNQPWLDFAKENEGGPVAENYIGHLLESFIANQEVWHIYEIAINQVRAGTKGEVLWSFRCDSPACRRFMKMQISKDEEGLVEFKSHIYKEELRSPARLLDPHSPRTQKYITMCSWCKKVQLDTGEWVEVERAVEALHLFGNVALPQFTHSICPDCHHNIFSEGTS
ncbi:hypothetical protein P0Y35_16190 [Kiritimatiellaeota bacterium B1221]|nr:hypothetical protein [Kiritimatiellaeota bacterium B1221]